MRRTATTGWELLSDADEGCCPHDWAEEREWPWMPAPRGWAEMGLGGSIPKGMLQASRLPRTRSCSHAQTTRRARGRESMSNSLSQAALDSLSLRHCSPSPPITHPTSPDPDPREHDDPRAGLWANTPKISHCPYPTGWAAHCAAPARNGVMRCCGDGGSLRHGGAGSRGSEALRGRACSFCSSKTRPSDAAAGEHDPEDRVGSRHEG